jgi:adenylate cyclase
VPPEVLEHLANRLSGLARDVVAPPVRFIKSIGDAVMFVSTDPVSLLKTVLSLIVAGEKYSDLPQMRAGIATGMAVSRSGDWFGSPVNVASRITGVADPGAVLVSESTRDAIDSGSEFVTSHVGARDLKGVNGQVNLYRVHRSSATTTDDR